MDTSGRKVFILASLGLALAPAVALALLFGLPAYGRYQGVQNAENRVRVTAIEIHNTEQLIEVEAKRALVRVEEAKGIAKAQEIINATLTDRYLQHEAIKAQERMAGSPSHSVIYIPSGQNGIPLVRTVNEPGAGAAGKRPNPR